MTKRSHTGLFVLLVGCGVTACGADGKTLTDAERRTIGRAENAGCLTKAGHAQTEPNTAAGGAPAVAGSGGSAAIADAGAD